MTRPAVANVVELLRDAARRRPDHVALTSERTVTFGGLWDLVGRFSAGIRREGLEAGDRVICMVPMSVDLYVVLLGILKAGGVAVFVDPWIGMRQVAAFSAFAEPRAFVGIPRSHVLRLLDRSLRTLPITVTTGNRIGALPAGATLRELLSAGHDDEIHPSQASDPALITFTSGSSGVPKGANRTHRFLLAQHDALTAEFPMKEDDVDLTMFPVFALNNLAQGVTTVIPTMDFRHVARVDGADLARQMLAANVTTCTASPPFFDRLAEHGRDLRLRRILTGGAPVSDEQLERWGRVWPDTDIQVVYGSTEAEPVAHMSAVSRLEARRSTTRPAPGYCTGRPTSRLQTRVIRIERGAVGIGGTGWPANQLAQGDIGELVVSGEHVCRDYFRNPRAVAENKITEADGTVWHRMGDTGYLDSEGRFWLVGRVHSTIVRGGVAVHPQLLEQAVQGPEVRQVAALGLPDPALGERVVLVVVPESDAFNDDEIRTRVKRAGLVVDEIRTEREPLPMDPRHNAKVDYSALRARLQGTS